jgi:hypothetical protein
VPFWRQLPDVARHPVCLTARLLSRRSQRHYCRRKIDGICRKFAMKNLASPGFCTVKIFGASLFFKRTINRLSIAQVR